MSAAYSGTPSCTVPAPYLGSQTLTYITGVGMCSMPMLNQAGIAARSIPWLPTPPTAVLHAYLHVALQHGGEAMGPQTLSLLLQRLVAGTIRWLQLQHTQRPKQHLQVGCIQQRGPRLACSSPSQQCQWPCWGLLTARLTAAGASLACTSP